MKIYCHFCSYLSYRLWLGNCLSMFYGGSYPRIYLMNMKILLGSWVSLWSMSLDFSYVTLAAKHLIACWKIILFTHQHFRLDDADDPQHILFHLTKQKHAMWYHPLEPWFISSSLCRAYILGVLVSPVSFNAASSNKTCFKKKEGQRGKIQRRGWTFSPTF